MWTQETNCLYHQQSPQYGRTETTQQQRLRMNWSNIEKLRKLLKIGTIVLSSILKYCAKFKHFHVIANYTVSFF
jgi:hypothetical protein